jgi:hypothetical protein
VDQDKILAALVPVLGEENTAAWWKWITTSEPGWGRDGWRRLDTARADDCK